MPPCNHDRLDTFFGCEALKKAILPCKYCHQTHQANSKLSALFVTAWVSSSNAAKPRPLPPKSNAGIAARRAGHSATCEVFRFRENRTSLKTDWYDETIARRPKGLIVTRQDWNQIRPSAADALTERRRRKEDDRRSASKDKQPPTPVERMRTTNSVRAPPVPAQSADECERMNVLAQAAFGREVLRKVVDVILPLNDRGTGLPLYCVHPITGVATNFRFLAQMLGAKRRLFGIQAPTAKRNAEFPCSIESMSQYYVDQLIEFQPEGALMIGGHSVGAMIALEMAQQLRARGREVSLLVVFDGQLFNTGTELKSYNPLYWFKLLLNVPRWLRDVLLVDFTARSFCKTLFNKLILARKIVAAKIKGEGLTSGHAVEGFINLKIYTANHAAFMKTLFETQFEYVPKEYSGRVLVCVAKTQALTHLREVEVAWLKVAPCSDVIYFEGTHTSMMRAPDGLAVAKQLARHIAEIESAVVT